MNRKIVSNTLAGRGAGRYRQPYRIIEYLATQGLKMVDVARKADLAQSAVTDTVHGRRNSRRVLRVLVDLGCPTDILSLPDDMLPEGREGGSDMQRHGAEGDTSAGVVKRRVLKSGAVRLFGKYYEAPELAGRRGPVWLHCDPQDLEQVRVRGEDGGEICTAKRQTRG